MNADVLTAAAGNASHVTLSRLRLDEQNPRLPERFHGRSQVDLAAFLVDDADAIQIAESIVDNGYFTGEHLVVMPDGREPAALVVLEGNRRLTALLGLADPAVRRTFAKAHVWDVLAEASVVNLNSLIPVVIVADREEAAPMIGFRHFTGIKKWRPFEQARYVRYLVDDRGLSIKEAARTMGSSSVKVGNAYRNLAILEQARTTAGIPPRALETAEEEFSLLTVAMANGALRKHLDAPLASQLRPGTPPVPEDRTAELVEVFGWIYGAEDGRPAVIQDSRQMGALAELVETPLGLNAVRQTHDLAAAREVVNDDADRKSSDQASIASRHLASTLRVLEMLEQRLTALDPTELVPLQDGSRALLVQAQRIYGMTEAAK